VIDTSGPAFPCHTNPLPDKLANAPQGMSLRDYFAASFAPVLIMRFPREVDCGPADTLVAETAYRLADAMLRARANELINL